ncbi:MAG: ComEA family DNA-binding protein [Myxococcota bacterium]
MRPEPAVRGTAVVAVALLAAALLRPPPAPVEGPVVRAGDRWLPLAELGAAAIADVRDGDTVRLFEGWALPVRAPAAVEWIGPPPRVSLNHATLAQLEALPGVGPAIARRIVAARPFRRAGELDAVRGIGPKRLDVLVRLVEP